MQVHRVSGGGGPAGPSSKRDCSVRRRDGENWQTKCSPTLREKSCAEAEGRGGGEGDPKAARCTFGKLGHAPGERPAAVGKGRGF